MILLSASSSATTYVVGTCKPKLQPYPTIPQGRPDTMMLLTKEQSYLVDSFYGIVAAGDSNTVTGNKINANGSTGVLLEARPVP